jgi:hypothetical protein
MTTKNREYQHPLVIRITHWVNFDNGLETD